MDIGTTLMLDSTGDLYLDERHMFVGISGEKKAAQDLRVRLQSAQGSLATDPAFALDTDGLIAAGDNTPLQESIIKQCLQGYRHTKSVDELSSHHDAVLRRATISARVTLDNGTQITVNTEV